MEHAVLLNGLHRDLTPAEVGDAVGEAQRAAHVDFGARQVALAAEELAVHFQSGARELSAVELLAERRRRQRLEQFRRQAESAKPGFADDLAAAQRSGIDFSPLVFGLVGCAGVFVAFGQALGLERGQRDVQLSVHRRRGHLQSAAAHDQAFFVFRQDGRLAEERGGGQLFLRFRHVGMHFPDERARSDSQQDQNGANDFLHEASSFVNVVMGPAFRKNDCIVAEADRPVIAQRGEAAPAAGGRAGPFFARRCEGAAVFMVL